MGTHARGVLSRKKQLDDLIVISCQVKLRRGKVIFSLLEEIKTEDPIVQGFKIQKVPIVRLVVFFSYLKWSYSFFELWRALIMKAKSYSLIFCPAVDMFMLKTFKWSTKTGTLLNWTLSKNIEHFLRPLVAILLQTLMHCRKL